MYKEMLVDDFGSCMLADVDLSLPPAGGGAD